MAEKAEPRKDETPREKPAEKQVYDLKRRSLRSGDAIAPEKLLTEAGHDEAEVTITIDDPTADPPTDAKVMVIIEAADGKQWYPISHSWCGTSGRVTVHVPLRGREIRVRATSDMDNVIDIAVKAR